MKLQRWKWVQGLAVAAVALVLADVGAGAGAADAEPAKPPQIQRPERVEPVSGIEGRLARLWALRSVLAMDNTGTQYQSAAAQMFAGHGQVTLRAPGEGDGGDALAVKKVVAAITFNGRLTPVIQTRERIQDGQRQRYALGVYFADADDYAERIAVSNLEHGARQVLRKGDGVLVQEGETVLVDSRSGIQPDQGYAVVHATQGVCILEVPALAENAALPAARVAEPREQSLAVLGGIGPLLALKLPVDPQTGGVNAQAGTTWRVALELTAVGGLPLNQTHAVAVNFTGQGAEGVKGAADALLFSGQYVFALGEDAFRGEPELLYALGDLQRRSDVANWKMQGAIGRGELKFWYSPGRKAIVQAQWTETLTQLNIQAGSQDRLAFSGERTISLTIQPPAPALETPAVPAPAAAPGPAGRP